MAQAWHSGDSRPLRARYEEVATELTALGRTPETPITEQALFDIRTGLETVRPQLARDDPALRAAGAELYALRNRYRIAAAKVSSCRPGSVARRLIGSIRLLTTFLRAGTAGGRRNWRTLICTLTRLRPARRSARQRPSCCGSRPCKARWTRRSLSATSEGGGHDRARDRAMRHCARLVGLGRCRLYVCSDAAATQTKPGAAMSSTLDYLLAALMLLVGIVIITLAVAWGELTGVITVITAAVLGFVLGAVTRIIRCQRRRHS